MKASQVHESWAGSSSSEDTDRSICSSGRSSIKYARNISSTSSDAGQEHEHKPGQELQSRQEPPGVTDHFSDSAVPGKFERRDQLVCLWPGCRSETIFWRTADLEEHYRAVHSSNLRRFECPRSRCARKGLNGFAWADRLYEHMQFYHGHDLPKNSKRAGYSEKAKLLQPLSEISQAVTDHCFEDSKVCEHRDYSREYPRTDQEGYLLRNLERVWKSDNGEPLEPLLKSSQEIANDITGSSALLQRDPNGALESSLEGRSKKVRYSIIGRHFASLSVGSKTESNLPRLMSAEHEIPTSQIAAEGARSAASTSAEYTPEEGHFDMDVDTLVGDPPVLPVEANDFQDTHNSKSEPAINVKITHPAAMAVSLGIDELGPDGSESATEFNKQPAQRIDTHNTNNSRRFNVLLHNHVALTEWKSILSLIRKHYAEIMGPQNTGSVELLAHGNTPTVCVTCQYPERLQRTRLEDIIRPLGFPYLVGQGYIQRSGGDGVNLHTAANSSSDISGTCNQLARAFQYGPALSGFARGYVELRFGEKWERYALTSHHLLHIEDEHTENTDGLEGLIITPESFRQPTPGVCNGIYTLHGRPTAVKIRSSAKTDYENELSRLVERTRTVERYKRCGNVEHGNLSSAVHSLESSPSRFGEAIHSSGLCIAENLDLQMDWLLIGNVTTNRIGANTVGDTSPFMEGREWLRDSTLQAETAVISERDFHDLMSYCSELDPSQIGGLSRIHGRGCESGLADGHLSRWPVLATVGGMEPSFEWSFAPRYGVGLGVPGDSGAWIFTETGALLGQILGHNQFTQMTYYTPIWALFDHIKGVTGANEVRLPPKTLTSASDSGYESSCTPPDSTAPEKSGV